MIIPHGLNELLIAFEHFVCKICQCFNFTYREYKSDGEL